MNSVPITPSVPATSDPNGCLCSCCRCVCAAAVWTDCLCRWVDDDKAAAEPPTPTLTHFFCAHSVVSFVPPFSPTRALIQLVVIVPYFIATVQMYSALNSMKPSRTPTHTQFEHLEQVQTGSCLTLSTLTCRSSKSRIHGDVPLHWRSSGVPGRLRWHRCWCHHRARVLKLVSCSSEELPVNYLSILPASAPHVVRNTTRLFTSLVFPVFNP